MKRAKDFSTSTTSQSPAVPAAKKMKMTPPESSGEDPVSRDLGGQENGEWTKVERHKGKKHKKLEGKLNANPPRFLYSRGELLRRREAVGISDIRDLVLHLVTDAPPSSWVKVENPRSVQKVVTLLIPGLTPEVLSLPPLPTSATSNPHLPLEIPLPGPDSTDGVPFIGKTFSHACPTRAPGDQTRMHSVLSAFFQTPVSGDEKKRRMLERVTSERAQEKTPMRYLLTQEQMIENDYPVPSYIADVFEKPEGWRETPELSSNANSTEPRILSIDCEMCQTEDGKQLARVCIIDYASGIVVFDKMVKPTKPITDYLTRWSGITAEAMEGATTTFQEVQAQVLAMFSVSPTPVLLGHSLESDLKALKICHPLCIDTAVIFHHPRGRPLKPGLAWLTKKWCGRDIQNRGEGGHDPEEDARACLDLLKKKVANGPGYGEFKVDYESIFERMSRARNGVVSSAVVDHGNPASWHGSKATSTIACTTDQEVVEGLLSTVPSHTFTFGRLTALADAQGWITHKSSNEVAVDAVSPIESSDADVKAALSGLDSHLRQLYEALPPRTALIIFTGHSDPRQMAALNARKSAFENAVRSVKSSEELESDIRWTSADGRALEEAVEKAKRGLLFLGIKDAK
ncbi:ribonuclease H-like protein [Irpex rosettiformis]|uniref:Ribonuclease H-like protein n=1 Tax=Irpex rosettiformis TaxID=378272 RepID=A0ACB8UDQ2_9APHY|nr:ribonuclease H-like protein [Irpex rosettiformis]